MGANEAKEYGIVDEVITNRELAAVPRARRRELSTDQRKTAILTAAGDSGGRRRGEVR